MSPEPSIGRIYQTALKHRAALLREERAAAGEMVRAYGGVWERIRAKLDVLLAERDAALARGEEVTAAWLWNYERLTTLERQVEQELYSFGQMAGTTITEQQRRAVAAAEAQSEEQIGAVTRQFNRLPADAVTDLVGFTGDGSPLRALLDELGPQGSKAVRDALIQGVSLGKNPRAIAREARHGAWRQSLAGADDLPDGGDALAIGRRRGAAIRRTGTWWRGGSGCAPARRGAARVVGRCTGRCMGRMSGSTIIRTGGAWRRRS